MKRVIKASSWYESKRECWKELKEYYNLLMNERRWEYMDEFSCLYAHYEMDLEGTLGYINSNNRYGGPIRRLYLVCSSRSWSDEELAQLKSGEKSIKGFDEDNIL